MHRENATLPMHLSYLEETHTLREVLMGSDSGEVPVGVGGSMSEEERGRYNFERWRSAFFSPLLRGRGVQAG